jgi:diadenosine tetraphosphate (Ap4A) HIT family hydrolase
MKLMLEHVPGLRGDYDLSLNIGRAAGQTVKHLHFCVIPRAEGRASSGKGMARLIEEADKTG